MRLGRFAPPTPEQPAASPPAVPANPAVAQLVMRIMRPALAVEVMCARETPAFVRGANLCARVISAAGPWRRQGEWWAGAHADRTHPDADRDAARHGDAASMSAAGFIDAAAPAAYARDYYDLALADGGVYRVYCDLSSGQWFLEGLYD
jgi:hypothetical protein